MALAEAKNIGDGWFRPYLKSTLNPMERNATPIPAKNMELTLRMMVYARRFRKRLPDPTAAATPTNHA